LELFSLERRGRSVAGRPFRFILSRRKASLHPATDFSITAKEFRLLMHATRRVVGRVALIFHGYPMQRSRFTLLEIYFLGEFFSSPHLAEDFFPMTCDLAL
jgi:hypothetical protein